MGFALRPPTLLFLLRSLRRQASDLVPLPLLAALRVLTPDTNLRVSHFQSVTSSGTFWLCFLIFDGRAYHRKIMHLHVENVRVETVKRKFCVRIIRCRAGWRRVRRDHPWDGSWRVLSLRAPDETFHKKFYLSEQILPKFEKLAYGLVLLRLREIPIPRSCYIESVRRQCTESRMCWQVGPRPAARQEQGRVRDRRRTRRRGFPTTLCSPCNFERSLASS